MDFCFSANSSFDFEVGSINYYMFLILCSLILERNFTKCHSENATDYKNRTIRNYKEKEKILR